MHASQTRIAHSCDGGIIERIDLKEIYDDMKVYKFVFSFLFFCAIDY